MMIKKLVLGLAVCWCVTTNGTQMERLVSDIVRDPSNSAKLIDLVVKLTDPKEGFDNSLEANEHIINSRVALKNREDFSRVCCMVDAILRDWLDNCVNSLTYYVSGEETGKFGPFAL